MSEENQTETEAVKPDVSLNDFIVMVKLIDICSKRGAFEGAELKDVGTLRGRLSEFVEYHKPKEEEEDQSELDLTETEEKEDS